MSLTPPKRLFHVPSMSTVIYVNNADDVKTKGYAAISHVWGIQEMYTANELGVNSGVDWTIPLSDPNKMGRLVNAMKHHDKEYCWWDVLCMPQDKQDEINLEIPFMGDYYSGASITLVLSDAKYNITEEYKTWCYMISDTITTQRSLSVEEVEWMGASGTRNLLDIRHDKWFKRVWTLQESILSKYLVIVDISGLYLDLTVLFRMMGQVMEEYQSFIKHLFDHETYYRLGQMSAVMLNFNKNLLRLTNLMNVNTNRDCYKIHDRFYGIFGILGYTNFVADYNISMDDLNREAARHAYSKGDMSWIKLGGNSTNFFIQPMYEQHFCVGFTEDENKPEMCGVSFENKTLFINVIPYGKIVRCKKPDSDIGSERFLRWITFSLMEWEFRMDEIISLITQYAYIDENYTLMVGLYLTSVIGYMDTPTMHKMMDMIFGHKYMKIHFAKMMDTVEVVTRSHDVVVLIEAANVNIGRFPLLVYGDACAGDEIVVTKLQKWSRDFGIVLYSNKRKGVYLCRGMHLPEDLFAPRKFIL